ncbi:MAG: hypothetical protein RIQ90_1267 [Bacteroidota bacterium]|jgi:hypothetical protein
MVTLEYQYLNRTSWNIHSKLDRYVLEVEVNDLRPVEGMVSL